MRHYNETTDTITYTFNSVTELGMFVRDAPVNPGCFDPSSDNNSTWCGPFKSMDAVTQAAIQGGRYPEGAKELAETTIDLDVDASVWDQPQVTLGPVGYAPDVPSAIQGLPDNMYCEQPVQDSGRLLRIGVNVSASAGVKHRDIVNRGRAILSVISALQAAKYSVELWAVERSHSNGQKFSIETRIKSPDMHWDADSAAFALTNVSYLRRICFRIMEVDPVAYKTANSGYGAPDMNELTDFDLGFRGLNPHVAKQYNTPEAATTSVRADAVRMIAARREATAA